jgi:hypothetical protein
VSQLRHFCIEGNQLLVESREVGAGVGQLQQRRALKKFKKIQKNSKKKNFKKTVIFSPQIQTSPSSVPWQLQNHHHHHYHHRHRHQQRRRHGSAQPQPSSDSDRLAAGSFGIGALPLPLPLTPHELKSRE